jgi:putative ABC transport system ATP-binding protein
MILYVTNMKGGNSLDSIINIQGIRKIYRMGQEKIIALNQIDLQIPQGEICCLLGASGSGKSTLLNMMAGLEKPTKGSVQIKGQYIEKMNEAQLAKFRQKYIGFIFQSYNLIPSLTALENVCLPLVFQGMSKKKREKLAKEMLESVGLGSRLKHKPNEMSGGQQQRVSIARAFVNRPTIIFADEPTGNLDTHTTIEILELMTSMAKKYNQTMVVVSHDTEISDYADRLIHMKDGEIISIEQKSNGRNEIIYEKAE